MKGTQQNGLARTEGEAPRPVAGGLAVMPMDEFLRACGATGPLRLLVEKRGLTAKRWSAPQPFALVGRDPAADLSLDHPRVDEYHAYIQIIEGGAYWVDLGSQAGTRWESGTARSGWLNYPQGIGLGPYVIQLASEDRDASALIARRAIRPDPFASRPPDSDDLPRVTLEFRRDSSKPIRWRMRHILTLVGSSPHCKVRLSAPGVSPFHCSLLRTALGMWVVNLLGPGGLTLNGSSVRASRLEDGDELRIGDVLIRVLFQAPGAANGEIGPPAGGEMGRTTLLAHPTMASREISTRHPQAAWMAPGREAGRLLAERVSSEGDLSASLLASVLDQFGQMQQQFLDQFQQTTMMMFRALGTMHRDQMEELREKLDSLHQIGENLQAFQAQMSTTVAPGADRPSRPAHDAGRTTSPDPEFAGPAAGDGDDGGQGRPSVASTVREPLASAVSEAEQLRAKVRSIVDQPNIPSMNVHEWLIGRIAALEDEQRSRWQKILDLVRGR
jgi:pSer/pThr/pTyr-binding forkhead associated (FHA) protein